MLNKILLKISGFIIIVSVISNMPEFFGGLLSYRKQDVDSGTLVSFVFINTLPFVIGIIMVMASTIKKEELPNYEKIRYEYLAVLGLGIYLLFNSLSDAVFHISNYMYIKSDVGMGFSIHDYNYPMMIATIFELIFSLLLIFFSKKVVSFIEKDRH